MTEKVLRSDARRNLELILQAAAEAFAEGGLDVGVADIARRAGVGTATIFRRFPTKEDLVAAVFNARLHEMVTAAREVAELPGGMDAVRTFFERAIEFQIRDRGFLESLGKRRFAGDARFASCRDEIFQALTVLVEKAQEAGELRTDVSPNDLPILLHALGSGAVFIDGEGTSSFHRRYLELVLDGLRPEGASRLSCDAPTVDEIDRSHEVEPA